MLIKSLTLPLCACVESDMSRRKKKKNLKTDKGFTYSVGPRTLRVGALLLIHPKWILLRTYTLPNNHIDLLRSANPNYVCMQDDTLAGTHREEKIDYIAGHLPSNLDCLTVASRLNCVSPPSVTRVMSFLPPSSSCVIAAPQQSLN